MGPKTRGGPGQGAVGGSRDTVLWYGGRNARHQPAQSASEPSSRLAPRLDRREQNLPWAPRHFIIFPVHGKRRACHVERAVVCSRAVTSALHPLIRKAVTVVVAVLKRLGVGVASRPADAIGPAPVAGSSGGSSISAIGNGGASRRRQLTSRRRARVSAQPVPAKIVQDGCAIGRAVTFCWWCGMKHRASVFAAYCAAWRYDECWTGRHAIGSGVGVGAANV
jgi:hypothetical protein